MPITKHAGQAINNWIKQKTGNVFERPITPSTLNIPTPPTQMLTNVVYFKGAWQTSFDKSQTRKEPNKYFDKSSIWSRTSVEMMHRMGEVGYFDGGTFQVIELPYKGKDVSMIVLLPRTVDGLPTFEESMTAENLGQWLSQLRPTPQVAVSLPKFKVLATFEFDGVLGRMGMQHAFNPFRADFSAMSGKTDSFIHNGNNTAYLIANEEGTEAAAETIITEKQSTFAIGPPSSATVFRADHPFVFLVRENKSGAILFMGRVAEPAM